MITYFDVLPWELDTMILGRFSHITLTGMGSNLILHWLQKYVIVNAGETRGSRTDLFVIARMFFHVEVMTARAF